MGSRRKVNSKRQTGAERSGVKMATAAEMPVRVTVNRDVSNWELRWYSEDDSPISSMIDMRIGGMRLRAVTAYGTVFWYAEDVCSVFCIVEDDLFNEFSLHAALLNDNDPKSRDNGHLVVNSAGLNQLFKESIAKAMSNYEDELKEDLMSNSENANMLDYWPNPPEDVGAFKDRLGFLLRSIDDLVYIYRTLMTYGVENAEPVVASVKS